MDSFAIIRKDGGADAQNVFNGAFYQSTFVLRTDPKEGLDPQEIVTLLKYQNHIVGRDVLDIGIGNGRTAAVLAVLARCYVAIDYAPLVVAEARRVLREGGLLVFSSHNRCYVGAERGPRLRVSRNPVTFVFYLVRYLRSMRLHRRMKPLRRYEDDYALLDDCGPDHALLHYYVDRTAQQRQLEAAGFEVLEVLDKRGATVGPGEMAPESSCLMYVARKA